MKTQSETLEPAKIKYNIEIENDRKTRISALSIMKMKNKIDL